MQKHKLFNNKSYPTLILALTLFLSACDNTVFQSGIDQGKIEYDITYPNIPEDNVMLDLMPKTMLTTFVDNNFRSDVVAGMGIFKTSIISMADQDKLVHSIKMLKTKYASELTEADWERFNPEFNKIEVSLLNETKEIAGYLCKSADIKVLGDSVWTYKAFYTEEINIENPNSRTIFKNIKGVLMEYEIVNNNILMRFSATKVIQEDIDISAVELEDDYEMVDPMKLKSEIDKLFSNIM